MASVQFIECKFPSSERRYSYGNNGDPVRIGDFVLVQTKTGVQTVEVTGLLDGPPNLPGHVELKYIIGPSNEGPSDS